MLGQGTESMNGEKHEHPIEHEWHERWDHETDVNREGELTMMSILCDRFTLGPPRGRNRTTWVFSPDPNVGQGPNISRYRLKCHPG